MSCVRDKHPNSSDTYRHLMLIPLMYHHCENRQDEFSLPLSYHFLHTLLSHLSVFALIYQGQSVQADKHYYCRFSHLPGVRCMSPLLFSYNGILSEVTSWL